MRVTNRHLLFIFLMTTGFFISCQKEVDGLITAGPVIPVNQKPRVGTIWTYRYYTYNIDGSLHSTETCIHKAQSEEIIAGEKWLKIVNVAMDTVVYLLNAKTGGLFQYTNNNSFLLCKYPAMLNDLYPTFNEGSTENFSVKGVNDTLPTGIGDVPANYYEGVKGIQLIDLIWYNDHAWIVRKTQYRNRSLLTPFYFKYYTYFLDRIVY